EEEETVKKEAETLLAPKKSKAST
ncbi:60S ribosomal protein L17-1-like protein, partial [Corchorus capsularis]